MHIIKKVMIYVQYLHCGTYMKSLSKKSKLNKYFAAAVIGFALGLLNFLFIYYIQSSCSLSINHEPFIQIFFFVVDIPMIVLTQLFIMKGARKFTILLTLLFLLLGFSPIGSIGPSCKLNYCVPRSDFSCYSVVISNSGNLSIQFENNIGSPLYNVGMACAELEASFLVPDPPKAMVFLSSHGNATPMAANGPAAGAFVMMNGQKVNVSELKCWGANAGPLNVSNVHNGTVFMGTLWLNYTTSPGTPSNKNPMHTMHLIDVGATAR
jgi:hypothetical protein